MIASLVDRLALLRARKFDFEVTNKHYLQGIGELRIIFFEI